MGKWSEFFFKFAEDKCRVVPSGQGNELCKKERKSDWLQTRMSKQEPAMKIDKLESVIATAFSKLGGGVRM